MSLLMLVGFIAVVLKAVSGGKRKREDNLRKQVLQNQQQMLNQILGQNGLNQYGNGNIVPSFGNSMAPSQQEQKRFSIGWILFFVVLALILFWLFGPFFELLSVVGWDNFVDIFFSGKY
jgi:hypothetical protein